MALTILCCLSVACASRSIREDVGVVPAVSMPAATGLPTISKTAVEPKTLDAGRDGVARVRCEIDAPAHVRVDIVDDLGYVVRHLDLGQCEPGACEASWDGRDEHGTAVAAGVYRYAIRAGNAAGESVYEPSAETGGEELLPREFTFDERTGELVWVMPKAGRARLRAGIEDFPHLVTLLDWTPMEGGRQSLVWDGHDASGRIRFVDHPKRVILLSLYALPDNTILVPRGENERRTVLSMRAREAEYASIVKPNGPYIHARHEPAICHEAELTVEFLGAIERDERGVPILSGRVPVRVQLAADSASALVDSKYEIAFYEDLTFLFEEEDAVDPFTFLWDVDRLSAGEHLLTIDVIGYDDHFGVLTVPVRIGGKP